ncbi:hypothetical protein ACFQMB_04010 [Pseudobowmanella zhangzhouensis]|uniref:hypothetical protein n=1 Tax=Pseudobowmanella zhangzhouensis TaxID=1537679 RepID=UPI003621E4D4
MNKYKGINAIFGLALLSTAMPGQAVAMLRNQSDGVLLGAFATLRRQRCCFW